MSLGERKRQVSALFDPFAHYTAFSIFSVEQPVHFPPPSLLASPSFIIRLNTTFLPFVQDIAKDTVSRPHLLLVPSLRVTPLSYPNLFFCAFYAPAVRSVKIPFTGLPGCDFRQLAIDDW